MIKKVLSFIIAGAMCLGMCTAVGAKEYITNQSNSVYSEKLINAHNDFKEKYDLKEVPEYSLMTTANSIKETSTAILSDENGNIIPSEIKMSICKDKTSSENILVVSARSTNVASNSAINSAGDVIASAAIVYEGQQMRSVYGSWSFPYGTSAISVSSRSYRCGTSFNGSGDPWGTVYVNTNYFERNNISGVYGSKLYLYTSITYSNAFQQNAVLNLTVSHQ